MNEFVNFGKRDVDLPPGCKDLIDVLRKPKGREVCRFTSQPGGLAEVPKYVSHMLKREAKTGNLIITWGQKNYVQLFYRRGKPTVLVVVHRDSGREQSVRQVFEAASIVPELDETARGASFVRVLGYPVPSGLTSAKRLICQLLRSGYGLTDDVRVQFGVSDDDAS